jgi:hypothetical protein
MILLVSPNAKMAATVRTALASMGEEVQIAATTAEGLTAAGAARVVVLDLLTETGGISGEAFADVAAPIVTLSRCYEQPIVTTTAEGYDKPFTLARLKEAVAVAA